MPKARSLVALVLTAAGCALGPTETESSGESEIETALESAPVDDDGDGIDDAVEDALLAKHAPVLYLPLSLDWTLPANVDWYLARAKLRFHHAGCSDCQVLGVGTVSQSTLVTQSHRKKKSLFSFGSCGHRNDLVSSDGDWDSHHHFFLQPHDDAVHGGSQDPADWVTYGHAYPRAGGGIQLQYWFFYPYNDNFASFNHEADWESITVALAPNGAPSGVYFCAHGDCSTMETGDRVTWLDETHPMVWVADGSHASYPNQWDCDRNVGLEGVLPINCETDDAYRWFTWTGGRAGRPGYQGGGVINVGEKDAPRSGQSFVRYRGRWGELGTIDDTSGPPGPAFQDSWDLGRAP